MNKTLTCGGVIVLGILAYIVYASVFSRSAESTQDVADVVYICKETNAVMAGPLGALPALNPRTGRRTLVRALYCSQCLGWYPIPSPEMLPGNPLSYRCPRHHVPMSLEGPVPEYRPFETGKGR